MFTVSVDTFGLQQQSRLVATEIMRPEKPKMCNIWPFMVKVCQLFIEALVLPGYYWLQFKVAQHGISGSSKMLTSRVLSKQERTR